MKQPSLTAAKLRVDTNVGQGDAEGRQTGEGAVHNGAEERAEEEALPEPIHMPVTGTAVSIPLLNIPHLLKVILQHFVEDLKCASPGSDEPIWQVGRECPLLPQGTCTPDSSVDFPAPSVLLSSHELIICVLGLMLVEIAFRTV